MPASLHIHRCEVRGDQGYLVNGRDRRGNCVAIFVRTKVEATELAHMIRQWRGGAHL